MQIFFLLLLVPVVCLAVAPSSEPSGSLRVMSFNVRNSNAHDGANAWPDRKALFVQTIRETNADLVGFQEVLFQQHEDIQNAFPDYTLVGVGRNDGKTAGEYSCIMFRNSRFDSLKSGTFWLSPEPDKVASVGWDAGLTRICTWVVLRDKSTGQEFLIANTHFDDRGELARRESAKLLIHQLPQIAGNLPIILTGDFNTTEDDPCYQTLVSPSDPISLADSFREVHPTRSANEASFHGFRGATHGSRIDWILHSPRFATISAGIDHHHSPDGSYPSDHFPVTADLRWR